MRCACCGQTVFDMKRSQVRWTKVDLGYLCDLCVETLALNAWNARSAAQLESLTTEQVMP